MKRPLQPLIVRITHWVGAYAMICMILSGWQIYNASPVLPFAFPRWMTLGGWLAGALAWHFAAMWLLVIDGLVYVAFGVFSGHFRNDFLPITPAGVWRDLTAALTFRLKHRLGHYNTLQKLLYLGVLLVRRGDAPMTIVARKRLRPAEANPELARLDRRLLLRGRLSLGALTLLTGCDLEDHDGVNRVLWGMSRWNDRVRAWLFDPHRLAATYPIGDHQAVSLQCVLSGEPGAHRRHGGVAA